jgi:hypothetical protein
MSSIIDSLSAKVSCASHPCLAAYFLVLKLGVD